MLILNTLISDSEKKLFAKVANISAHLNIKVYAVGGFVRDKILNRETKDIDFVCLGDGIAFAQTLQAKYFPHTALHIFKNFGTAHLDLPEFIIEFVGARKESYNINSRNPEVHSGTFMEDQMRRDFTINTLMIEISTSENYTLIDTFSGMKDLEEKIIQTPQDPNKTFFDDPLRILRAVRFATQLEFEIEAKTVNAMAENAHRLEIIAKERIAEEMNKIVLARKPSIGFVILDGLNLLPTLLPELLALKGIACIDGIKHKDNFYHSLQVLDNISAHTNNVWLRWAALLHDTGKTISKRFEPATGWTFHGHEIVSAKMIPKIFQRLGLAQNEKMNFVRKIISLHHRPISLTKENITDSAIRRLLFDAGDDVEDLMMLCEADITSKNKNKVLQYLTNFNAVREKMILVEAKDKIRNWEAPISGEVIMETFKIPPSKKIAIIKEAIKEAIFDGQVENNFEAAMLFMKDFVKANGL